MHGGGVRSIASCGWMPRHNMTMTLKKLYFDIIQKQHYYIKYKQMCVNIMSWRSY